MMEVTPVAVLTNGLTGRGNVLLRIAQVHVQVSLLLCVLTGLHFELWFNCVPSAASPLLDEMSVDSIKNWVLMTIEHSRL